MTTDIDKEKLRELCERATPGPWESTVCDDGLMMVATTGDTICFGDPNHKEPDDTANGDFIAASRTALPALLALTDAQAAKIAELEAENALSRAKIEKMICQQEGAVCIENYYDLLKEFNIPCVTHTPGCDTFISPFDALVGWKREADARIDQLRKQVEGLRWEPISTAPETGEDLELLLQDGEISGARWNNERYCMLGSRAGSFPPGWSPTRSSGVDLNLPMTFDGNEPTHWRLAAASALEQKEQG